MTVYDENPWHQQIPVQFHPPGRNRFFLLGYGANATASRTMASQYVERHGSPQRLQTLMLLRGAV